MAQVADMFWSTAPFFTIHRGMTTKNVYRRNQRYLLVSSFYLVLLRLPYARAMMRNRLLSAIICSGKPSPPYLSQKIRFSVASHHQFSKTYGAGPGHVLFNWRYDVRRFTSFILSIFRHAAPFLSCGVTTKKYIGAAKSVFWSSGR